MKSPQAWSSTTVRILPFSDAFWNKAGRQQSHQVSNRLEKELLPYLISGLIWNRSFSIVQPLLKIGLRMHFRIHVRKEKDQEKGNSSQLLFCFNNYFDLEGSSMSFYSDFILILSWFYPDFILILSWFYPDFILILSKFYPDKIRIEFG